MFNSKLLSFVVLLTGCASQQPDFSQQTLKSDTVTCKTDQPCLFKLDALDIEYQVKDNYIVGSAKIKANGSALRLFSGQVRMIFIDQDRLCQEVLYFSGNLFASTIIKFKQKASCSGDQTTVSKYNLVTGDGERVDSYRQTLPIFN